MVSTGGLPKGTRSLPGLNPSLAPARSTLLSPEAAFQRRERGHGSSPLGRPLCCRGSTGNTAPVGWASTGRPGTAPSASGRLWHAPGRGAHSPRTAPSGICKEGGVSQGACRGRPGRLPGAPPVVNPFPAVRTEHSLQRRLQGTSGLQGRPNSYSRSGNSAASANLDLGSGEGGEGKETLEQ